MMTYEDMQKQIDQYNWDDGFEFVKNLLNEPLCDLALAIKIFYLGDGYGFLINGNSCQNAWNTLMQKLYQDILAGKYKNNHPYEIPLTKVQVHKMKKMNIPTVFYEGYEGD